MKNLKSRSQPLLGTFVEVSLSGDTDIFDFNIAFSKMREVENLFSNYEMTSDISKLNLNPYKKIELNPLTVSLLKKSLNLMEKSEGLFDITTGVNLLKNGLIPNFRNDISEKKRGKGRDIILEDLRCTLNKPLWLSLNGIAKGFAVDLAVEALKEKGIESGIINAGGDLRVFGQFKLPIKLRQRDGRLKVLGEYSNCSVASSGKSNRPHPSTLIINPKSTNFNSHLDFVTIKANETWLADGLTKVAMNFEGTSKERELYISSLGGQIL